MVGYNGRSKIKCIFYYDKYYFIYNRIYYDIIKRA